MVKKLLFFILLTSSITFSQSKKVLLKGKVIDSIGVVRNANIVNIKSNQGTFTSDLGYFEIYANVGDSLRISSIQHKTKTLVVNSYNYQNKIITIPLELVIYTLEEFELRRNNLSGRLGIDSKSVPKNRKDSLLRAAMDFSNVNMKIVEEDDYIDKRVRPNINNTVPTLNFVGVGGSAYFAFKYSEKLWKLRRELEIKKAFPYKIMNELGEDFFFKKLKIPVEKYFHFLDYCNPFEIENLHHKGRILEVIKILRRESISYLNIIKKE